MPKVPLKRPYWSASCDPRLPQAALAFRLGNSPQLTSLTYLSRLNVTAWLYRDDNGDEKIKVNPNVTIQELIKQFGRAKTPDAETGIHSEGVAAQWFHDQGKRQKLQVLRSSRREFRARSCVRRCSTAIFPEFPGTTTLTGTAGTVPVVGLSTARERC